MQGKSDFMSLVVNYNIISICFLWTFIWNAAMLFFLREGYQICSNPQFLLTHAGVASTHNNNGGYIESFTQYINFYLLPFWGPFCTFQWDECSQLIGDSDIAGFLKKRTNHICSSLQLSNMHTHFKPGLLLEISVMTNCGIINLNMK